MTIRSLHDTISRLAAVRQKFAEQTISGQDQLADFTDFGSNPGALDARFYLPQSLPRRAPLVVVLHGCTQTASGYDAHAAWSEAADEHGFAVLFPQQQRANNPNLCFNWFLSQDARRQGGEALSIRQMVAAVEARHGTDSRRVFVTGLSAGGAMAAVMLATYPDVFAGGAIIAGLPFGSARSVPEAFDRMRGHGGPGPDALARLVRSASGHEGPWPKVSVWHGTSDATVDVQNAQLLVDQWRIVQGLSEAPSRVVRVNGHVHRVWTDARGHDVIEEHLIAGMGHGTPLSVSQGYGEQAGPFMLDVGISSTRKTLDFWGLSDGVAADLPLPLPLSPARQHHSPLTYAPAAPVSGIQKTIDDALRTAGLLR